MKSGKCGNCKTGAGPFYRFDNANLCKDIPACNKRRAKIDKDTYGEETIGQG